MRVAIDVRVSTTRQAQQQTIEQQRERLVAHVGVQGWSLREEHVFRDDGYSGSVLARPGLDRLRDAARNRELDRVIVTAPDRLARNYVQQMVLLEEFARGGCAVDFLDRPMGDDPHDQLLLQIRGAVAEYERTLIAERMRRGRLSKLRAGLLLPWTRPPYGYRLDPGRPRDPSGVTLAPDEAAVVAELFALYLEPAMSLAQLAKTLQRRGIPTPSGNHRWSGPTIRGILGNPTYTGQVYAQRTRYRAPQVRRSATHAIGRPHGSATPQPPDTWIAVGAVPAIVAQARFELVQAKLAQNRAFSSRNNTAHQYLLRALVSCGRCLLACTARTLNGRHHYYLCNGKHRNGSARCDPPCPSRYIPAAQLDELVWADLCALVRDPEHIHAALARAQGGAWLPQELQSRRENLRQGRASLRQQLDRLTDAYLRGVIPLDEYERRRRALEQQEQGLANQEGQLDGEADRHRELAGVAQSLTAFCQRIAQGLATATFEQRRQLLLLLVDRVVVTDDAVEIRYVLPTTPESEPIRFCHLRKDYFHHPAPGQQHEAALDRVEGDDFQGDAARGGGGDGPVAGVARIHIGQFDVLPGRLLDRLGQGRHLGAVLCVRGGDMQRQQVAQRVHRHVDLRAPALLVPVVARPAAALRARLQRAGVEHRRARLGHAVGQLAEQHPQIARHVLEHLGLDPALRLLVDRVPRRQVVHHAPTRARPDDPARPVEHLAQRVLALRRVLLHQRQVRGHERPLVIAHVARVRLPGRRFHRGCPSSLQPARIAAPRPDVHNTL